MDAKATAGVDDRVSFDAVSRQEQQPVIEDFLALNASVPDLPKYTSAVDAEHTTFGMLPGGGDVSNVTNEDSASTFGTGAAAVAGAFVNSAAEDPLELSVTAVTTHEVEAVGSAIPANSPVTGCPTGSLAISTTNIVATFPGEHVPTEEVPANHLNTRFFEVNKQSLDGTKPEQELQIAGTLKEDGFSAMMVETMDSELRQQEDVDMAAETGDRAVQLDQAPKVPVNLETKSAALPEEIAKAGTEEVAPTGGDGDMPAIHVVQNADGGGLDTVGKKVKKKFGRRNFFGQVESYDEETKWYKIRYEDGDEEELEWAEVEPLFVKPEGTPKCASRKRDRVERGDKEAGDESPEKSKEELSAEGVVTDEDGPTAVLASLSAQRPERQKFKKMLLDEDPVMQAKPRKPRQPKKLSDKPLLRKSKAHYKNRFTKQEGDGEENGEAAGDVKAVPEAEAGRKRKHADRSGKNRNLKTKPDEDYRGPGKEIVHEKVKKRFGSKFFTGVIKYFFPQEGFYKVVYSDGDREDLWWHEIKPILVPKGESDEGGGTSSTTGDDKPKRRGRLPKEITAPETAVRKKTTSKTGSLRERISKGISDAVRGSRQSRKEAEIKKAGKSTRTVKHWGRRGRKEKQEVLAETPRKESNGAGVAEDRQLLKDASGLKDRPLSSTTEERELLQVGKLPAGGEQTSMIEHAVEVVADVSKPQEPEGPPAAITAAEAVVPSASKCLEFFGWGEVVGDASEDLNQLQAVEMLPTESPVAQLVASQHQLAVITAAGQVMVWRNRHGNVQQRTRQWEHIGELEAKNVVLLDIAGPNIDRSASGYAPEQEDQIPDPFYMAAVTADGEDFVFVGSQPQEEVRTLKLDEEPQFPGLKGAIAQSSGDSATRNVGAVRQVSVGVVEAVDESPFIGYITDQNEVHVRAATKDGAQEEVHHVKGFTGNPVKIQLGAAYCAIILTDNGKVWTWGVGSSADVQSFGAQMALSKIAPCTLATGSLHNRMAVDVGCCGKEFVALTDDGEIHQWTQGDGNAALGISNVPSPPLPTHAPHLPPSDKLSSISLGAGVCAGVTCNGKVHTWTNGMAGLHSGNQSTPLGRASGAKTEILILGNRTATGVFAVPGSLVVITSKK